MTNQEIIDAVQSAPDKIGPTPFFESCPCDCGYKRKAGWTEYSASVGWRVYTHIFYQHPMVEGCCERRDREAGVGSVASVEQIEDVVTIKFENGVATVIGGNAKLLTEQKAALDTLTAGEVK